MPTLTRVSAAQRTLMKAPLRIVSIGGGTGLSTLLSGLKKHARGAQDSAEGRLPAVDIAAVVTVSDDGGSSGRLRRDFDILPPGDIRNCMTALSEDEHLMSRLFQYRFDGGRGLKGHSFGNLFLTALHQITGDSRTDFSGDLGQRDSRGRAARRLGRERRKQNQQEPDAH